MRAVIVTGKPKDYIRIEAEDIKDCCALYEMSKGKYFQDHPDKVQVKVCASICKYALELDLPTLYDTAWPSPETLEAIDRTS